MHYLLVIEIDIHKISFQTYVCGKSVVVHNSRGIV